MNAASQVPSGVLISTSVSTISMPMSAAAVDDDDTDAAMPAPTKRAAKSRRVMSPGCDWLLGWLFSSSVISFVQRVYRISLADRTVRSSEPLGWLVPWHFLQGASAGPPVCHPVRSRRTPCTRLAQQGCVMEYCPCPVWRRASLPSKPAYLV